MHNKTLKKKTYIYNLGQKVKSQWYTYCGYSINCCLLKCYNGGCTLQRSLDLLFPQYKFPHSILQVCGGKQKENDSPGARLCIAKAEPQWVIRWLLLLLLLHVFLSGIWTSFLGLGIMDRRLHGFMTHNDIQQHNGQWCRWGPYPYASAIAALRSVCGDVGIEKHCLCLCLTTDWVGNWHNGSVQAQT